VTRDLGVAIGTQNVSPDLIRTQCEFDPFLEVKRGMINFLIPFSNLEFLAKFLNFWRIFGESLVNFC
jgi:hypothetical protein